MTFLSVLTFYDTLFLARECCHGFNDYADREKSFSETN